MFMVGRKLSHLKPDDILAGHSPAIIVLANKLRNIIKATIPEASEVAYPVWHAVGLRHPEAGYFCGIFPYKDHIKIYFEYGRFLPSDDRMLEGSGRKTRYIFIRTPKDIKVAAFKKLLKASINFKKNLPPNRAKLGVPLKAERRRASPAFRLGYGVTKSAIDTP